MAVILALVIARLSLDGLSVSFSMGVFALRLNAVVLATGAATGLVLGLLGAVPPAIRCLRLAIPVALKSA